MAHKILVVEDEKINISLLRFALREQEYDVAVASNGEEGLEKVKDAKPDLIILDIVMPGMDGYEFMEELHKIQGGRDIPVIVVTGNETMEDVFHLEGVKGYFIKPVSLTDLVVKIKECLGRNPGSH
ncbi:MAG TPA: two-component system response regulator [Candidatus Omnitrophica bacterium]|nr:MAG: hypothetical protein A2Z81_09280 [Omnitrophica WOR_2 bacterium GWA2_45_18]HBR15345.1 two-component system response regulator [Candidatus Omnitrophota bacterium]